MPLLVFSFRLALALAVFHFAFSLGLSLLVLGGVLLGSSLASLGVWELLPFNHRHYGLLGLSFCHPGPPTTISGLPFFFGLSVFGFVFVLGIGFGGRGAIFVATINSPSSVGC